MEYSSNQIAISIEGIDGNGNRRDKYRFDEWMYDINKCTTFGTTTQNGGIIKTFFSPMKRRTKRLHIQDQDVV